MSRYNDNIFTIFDLMEKKGLFRVNPANVDSIDPSTKTSLYKGPVQYPKMLYHPEGKFRITEPGQVVRDEFDKPQRVGQQKELISKLVESTEEEAVLRKLGWHDHPAKAIYAGGGDAPPISSLDQVKSLEDQLEALKKELLEAKANMAPPVPLTEEKKADNALSAAAMTKPKTVAA